MKRKKMLIQGVILAAVFVLAVVVFGYITNKKNDDMTADMGAATRPQVSFSYNGYAVNSLPVYKDKMSLTSVRDTVTPVNNGQLEMDIKAYENVIKSVEYIVYTLDGEEKLLENKISTPKKAVTLTFDGEGVLDEERIVEIVLHLDGDKDMFCYTRLKDGSGLNALECLDYIRHFHEKALDKAEGAGIGTAIEPSDEGNNTTLQHVTIHSDYDHVTWGDLEPQVEGGERWSIKEVNKSYTSVQLEYRVRCKGENDSDDVYAVKEFFRVRHISNGNRTYLLDYGREMNQLFDATGQMLSEKGIILGITDSDVPYMVNKDGTIVSFVQADELWNYNKNTDEMSLVFSFSDAENTDVRSTFPQHEIKLLETDASGNTTFAVYGYMNRGNHEGESGVAIYYYNMEQNSVEEKVFISSDKAYDRVAQEMGRLVYYNNEEDILYVLVDGTLYEINIQKNQKKELATGLDEKQYVVSDDGHIAAYLVSEEDEETSYIVVKNFSSGKEKTITCGTDESLRPLGFIKNDLAYGIARTADIGTTVAGQEAFPMYKIEIVNSKGKVVKTYSQDNIYILDADFSGNMITLARARKEGGSYTAVSEDYITNNEEEKESNIFVETYTTELKEKQVRLTYADGISDKEPKVLKPKQIMTEKAENIIFEEKNVEEKYYVYGYGKLQGIYDQAGKAVQKANEYNGVVVSAWQTYIWERGNRDLKYSIEGKEEMIESIRAGLTSGKTPVQVKDELSGGRSIDLTGCTTDQILYVVNQDDPVIAVLDGNTFVILTGYGETTVSYVDVTSGESYTISQEEMDGRLKAAIG